TLQSLCKLLLGSWAFPVHLLCNCDRSRRHIRSSPFLWRVQRATLAPTPASVTRGYPQPLGVDLSSGFDANLSLEDSEKLRCITQKQKPGLHDRVSYVLLVPKR